MAARLRARESASRSGINPWSGGVLFVRRIRPSAIRPAPSSNREAGSGASVGEPVGIGAQRVKEDGVGSRRQRVRDGGEEIVAEAVRDGREPGSPGGGSYGLIEAEGIARNGAALDRARPEARRCEVEHHAAEASRIRKTFWTDALAISRSASVLAISRTSLLNWNSICVPR